VKRNNLLFLLQCARRKNIGLGICAWDEITPNNLARFCTSIKYLIISLALLSSGCLSIWGEQLRYRHWGILADMDCKSTTKSTKMALMCLNQYLFSTDRSPDFSTYSKVELDKLLASFYVDARKKDGSKYKLSSLKAIRFSFHAIYNRMCC